MVKSLGPKYFDLLSVTWGKFPAVSRRFCLFFFFFLGSSVLIMGSSNTDGDTPQIIKIQFKQNSTLLKLH